jgi:hypothetical protein
MHTLWLRLIYTLHMTLPLPLAAAHIARLDAATAERLRVLFS